MFHKLFVEKCFVIKAINLLKTNEPEVASSKNDVI
tara:strand:- start:154966 stop:155070 length:105 start_codon:yes stop_codon:yes gene_type:complete